MDFFLQNNSVENSLICPKNKSASHCLTELFPIYPNNHWTIRWRDNHIVVPSSNRIKLKIDWFLVLVRKALFTTAGLIALQYGFFKNFLEILIADWSGNTAKSTAADADVLRHLLACRWNNIGKRWRFHWFLTENDDVFTIFWDF